MRSAHIRIVDMCVESEKELPVQQESIARREPKLALLLGFGKDPSIR